MQGFRIGFAVAGGLVCSAQAIGQMPSRSGPDYPAESLRAGHEGTVGFTVVVNERGRAESCEVTSSSGWPDLDAGACRTLKLHARFNPATDETGKKVKSTFSSKIKYKIPR